MRIFIIQVHDPVIHFVFVPATPRGLRTLRETSNLHDRRFGGATAASFPETAVVAIACFMQCPWPSGGCRDEHKVNNGVVYLDYEDSHHHGPLLCSFQ